MKQRLDTQVATAVGAMLVGRDSITLDVVASRLPAHIRAANPSLRCMTKALVGAGWVGDRRDGGQVVYIPAPEDDGEPADLTGHNVEGVAGEEVRLLIERWERLEEEKKGIADDIKDVAAEAKGRGYDIKAMRGIMKIRKKPKEEQQEEAAILEVYMRALGMMV
ncbi:Uncharacterized conserved protein, UPF0335 family [Sphingomonas gellani]|uniref:Uncharacterized conserved protein, UPF0335 family n=1 Tax=Sphingomonas gellani TaxID=1166340 RepID=A0A1H8BZX4_9SPHN|nr:Uncharacterized conserved protein, UPF0335 family [Sphingomonas gellani]